MICLRCGYCCIEYTVIIVNDPVIGPAHNNLTTTWSGERCPHLRGSESGEYSCAIHDKQWYPETPCAKHKQIESNENKFCRIGKHRMKQLKEMK